jgi:hypothetical protein
VAGDTPGRTLGFLTLVVVVAGCTSAHYGRDGAVEVDSDATGSISDTTPPADVSIQPRDGGVLESDDALLDASGPDSGRVDAQSPDADLRSREDSTGFCRPDGTCVCFEEGWGVCAGRETICSDLRVEEDCGACGRDCGDSFSVCRRVGGGCSCESGMCRQGELLEWWQSFGIFSPGFLQWFSSTQYDERGPGTVTFAAMGSVGLYVNDGVAHVGRRTGSPTRLTFSPMATKNRIRSGYAIAGQGYLLAEGGWVYFTNGELETVWRSADLGDVRSVCIMSDQNYLVLLGDGRVFATGDGPDWLGTGGVAPPANGFVEVGYPRPVVSLACHDRVSVAVLDDGTAWFAGERVLPESSSRYPLALVPEPANLTITRRFERVFSIQGIAGRMFCVASSEIGGYYACWYGFDPIRFVWGDLPSLPVEVREGDAGICGRFDLGGGSEEIRCIEDTADPRATRRLVWSNVPIGGLP